MGNDFGAYGLYSYAKYALSAKTVRSKRPKTKCALHRGTEKVFEDIFLRFPTQPLGLRYFFSANCQSAVLWDFVQERTSDGFC